VNLKETSDCLNAPILRSCLVCKEKKNIDIGISKKKKKKKKNTDDCNRIESN
jgi:hypothetical protein